MRYTTVFLDRDGVINRRRVDDYVKSWEEFEFLPGVKDALARLTSQGYRLIVVTNQRGIATGRMTAETVEEIHRRMTTELRDAGAEVAAVFYCPHDRGLCECRKPGIGMFADARRTFPEIEFSSSVMIGDSDSDMEAGARAGCRNIFVGWNPNFDCADSLADAVAKYLT